MCRPAGGLVMSDDYIHIQYLGRVAAHGASQEFPRPRPGASWYILHVSARRPVQVPHHGRELAQGTVRHRGMETRLMETILTFASVSPRKMETLLLGSWWP